MLWPMPQFGAVHVTGNNEEHSQRQVVVGRIRTATDRQSPGSGHL